MNPDLEHTEPSTGEADPRRLERPVAKPRLLAGVAAALAAYSGRSRLAIRLLFVLLALTGAGVLLYVALWALIPRKGEEQSWARRQWRTHAEEPAWIATLALLALALLLAAGHAVAIAALVAGVALLARNRLVRRVPA